MLKQIVILSAAAVAFATTTAAVEPVEPKLSAVDVPNMLMFGDGSPVWKEASTKSAAEQITLCHSLFEKIWGYNGRPTNAPVTLTAENSSGQCGTTLDGEDVCVCYTPIEGRSGKGQEDVLAVIDEDTEYVNADQIEKLNLQEVKEQAEKDQAAQAKGKN